MDAVFGPLNFRNEIIWHYRKWPSGRYTFQRNHDVLLFYAKSASKKRVFNQLYRERAVSTRKALRHRQDQVGVRPGEWPASSLPNAG
jgi:hypothetical protein